MLVVGSTHY